MIDLYTFTTPNGRKPAIALEELGLAYRVLAVDLSKGEQRQPDYLKINPNGKISAIVDGEVSVFESGAILIYLADKAGQLLPQSYPERSRVMQWLMFQMAGVGPMLGQLGHFKLHADESIPYAIERYRKEAQRLFGVMDRQLAQQDYLADDYSIADIATYPWVVAARDDMEMGLQNYGNLAAWVERLGERPAVQKGMSVLQG